MRFLLLICYCIFFAFSCKQNDRRIPRDMLSPKKMQEVLWDMMRADIFVNDYVSKKDSAADKKRESIQLYQQILHIHGISKEEFQKSYAFYQTRPVLLKSIMDSLNHHPDADPAKIYGPRTPVDSVIRKDSAAAI